MLQNNNSALTPEPADHLASVPDKVVHAAFRPEEASLAGAHDGSATRRTHVPALQNGRQMAEQDKEGPGEAEGQCEPVSGAPESPRQSAVVQQHHANRERGRLGLNTQKVPGFDR